MVISLFANAVAIAQTPQWTPSCRGRLVRRQPWIVGSNYIQSNTVNQIEMWQPETFDGDRIDLELGWAESLGINTLRVFLHDLLWEHESGGLQRRMDKLLEDRGKTQNEGHFRAVRFFRATPIRNWAASGSPSRECATPCGCRARRQGPDRSQRVDKALDYAEEVVAAFSIDKRVLAWDVWNEPDNTNAGRYSNAEPPNKADLMRHLLPKVFQYARAGMPTQPVTSGLWKGDWSSAATLRPIEKIQIELSDFISFQNYDGPRNSRSA